MREELNIFVDPKTRKSLQVKAYSKKEGHVLSGILYNGQRRFPIVNGIPRFVDKSLYQPKRSKQKERQTALSFGNKWNEKRFKSLGKGSARDLRRYNDLFANLLGCDSKSQLLGLLKKAKRTLNGGCGVAWSEFMYNSNPQAERHCIDLSLAVQAAYNNTRGFNNVIVSQASVLDIPYKDNSFDLVYSNGVIHHTINPKKAFLSLARKVRPGGTIGVYIYNIKPFIREFADQEIRKITTKMSYAQCMQFSQQMTELGKALSKIKTPLVLQKDIELLGMKKGKYNLQKFVYDHFVKCWYNAEWDSKFADLVNQDWYHPFYASHHTKEEITEWFKQAGMTRIKCRSPKGWEHSGFYFSGRKR